MVVPDVGDERDLGRAEGDVGERRGDEQPAQRQADRSGLRRDLLAGAGSRFPFPRRHHGATMVITAAPVSASRTATAAAGARPVASTPASTGPVM